MAKLKNRVGHQSSEEMMMSNTHHGGIIVSSSAESFNKSKRHYHKTVGAGANKAHEMARKSSTTKNNEDLNL